MIDKLIFLLLMIININSLFAQSDILVSYDCRTHHIDFIPPKAITSTKSFECTDWNFGQSGNIAKFDTNYHRGFNDFIRAQSLFDINDYPIRTIVKIFRYVNDTLMHWASGTMVSPNMVITCAHAALMVSGASQYWEHTFFDSLYVIPAFDYNFQENNRYGSSVSKKYYFPIKYYEPENIPGLWDIALIELHDPIGIETGWMGIAYHSNDEYYKNRLFHKFSYPWTYPNDCMREVNGDTMYYGYGALDFVSDTYLEYDFCGISGQSGSSLFYTDNTKYFAMGIHNHAGMRPKHFRINVKTFHAFKNILKINNTCIKKTDKNLQFKFSLEQNYPNPFNPITKIKFNVLIPCHVNIQIFNMLGKPVVTLLNNYQEKGEYELCWNAENLPSGLYFLILNAGEYSEIRKLVLQK